MEIPASSLINRYIACQGPLPNTCPDFWQMTWEQGSSMVVMLTTQVERGRVRRRIPLRDCSMLMKIKVWPCWDFVETRSTVHPYFVSLNANLGEILLNLNLWKYLIAYQNWASAAFIVLLIWALIIKTTKWVKVVLLWVWKQVTHQTRCEFKKKNA